MELSALGEFGLINRIAPLFSHLIPNGVEGIGDDCAIIPISETESLVVTTDLLVEDIHFLRHSMPAIDLGWKSLAVNLSDIAAMGAKPIGSFLSIGLPADVTVEWTDAFFEGMHQLSAIHGVPLLGGDTTRSPEKVVINITVVGKASSDKIKRRSTAQHGDVIATTGCVGDSAAGLWLLLNKIAPTPETEVLFGAHFRPRPHLLEGAWLAAQPGVHAMMDISDGIASDLPQILRASGCSATAELSQLPISSTLRNARDSYPWDIHDLAVGGGEDYCLLLTLDSSEAATIMANFESTFNHPLFSFGTIVAGTPTIRWSKYGAPIQLTSKGFQHF